MTLKRRLLAHARLAAIAFVATFVASMLIALPTAAQELSIKIGRAHV